jgi:hypothetical protein
MGIFLIHDGGIIDDVGIIDGDAIFASYIKSILNSAIVLNFGAHPF